MKGVGGPRVGGRTRTLSAHVFPFITGRSAGVKGGNTKGEKIQGIKLFFHLSQKARKGENKRRKENHFIMWGSRATRGGTFRGALHFSKLLAGGCPAPPRVLGLAAEFAPSGGARTEVAWMSALVISHVTSEPGHFLTLSAWLGWRGKRKKQPLERLLHTQHFHATPTLTPAIVFKIKKMNPFC